MWECEQKRSRESSAHPNRNVELNFFSCRKKITIKTKDFSHSYFDICKASDMVCALRFFCLNVIFLLLSYFSCSSSYESIFFTWHIVCYFLRWTTHECYPHANHKPMRMLHFTSAFHSQIEIIRINSQSGWVRDFFYHRFDVLYVTIHMKKCASPFCHTIQLKRYLNIGFSQRAHRQLNGIGKT